MLITFSFLPGDPSEISNNLSVYFVLFHNSGKFKGELYMRFLFSDEMNKLLLFKEYNLY